MAFEASIVGEPMIAKSWTWTQGRLVAGSLLASSACCATLPPSVEFLPFGSPADVTSVPGEGAGYELARSCGDARLRHGHFVLLGERSKPRADSEQLTLLKNEIILPVARDLDFAAGVGYGRVCSDFGVIVFLSSWRTVDKVVARLGVLVGQSSHGFDVEVWVRRPGSR